MSCFSNPPKVLSFLFSVMEQFGLRYLVFKFYPLLVLIGFTTATPTMELMFATVAGKAECSDCKQNHIMPEYATRGLRVAINCRAGSAEYAAKAAARIEKSGNFKVKIPTGAFNERGELKDECFLQIHDASGMPCLDKKATLSTPRKLVLKSKENGRRTFVTASEKLSFSSATCASAVDWPHLKRDGRKLMRPWQKHLLPLGKPTYSPWRGFRPHTLRHKGDLQHLYQNQKPLVAMPQLPPFFQNPNIPRPKQPFHGWPGIPPLMGAAPKGADAEPSAGNPVNPDP